MRGGGGDNIATVAATVLVRFCLGLLYNNCQYSVVLFGFSVDAHSPSWAVGSRSLSQTDY